MAQTKKKAAVKAPRRANAKARLTAPKIEDLIESYSRINVPIYSSELIKTAGLDFSDIKSFNTTLKEIRASLGGKFKKSIRTDTISDIKQSFRKEKLVFVLGAGVSMTYGLPSWDTLLQKLMVTTLQREKKASGILSKLFSKLFNPSPLIAGRYLQKYFENNNQSFEEAVQKILYDEIKRDTVSQLMTEIVKFCIAPGKSPNLNSIITYNFDDILEQSIRKISVDLPFKSIFGTGMDVDTGEFPIYHVHGFLPENEKLTTANQITFGENIYHKQYTDTYSWNNIVQINKFRENNCLFIGTSLTDPNTRRLLDIANQQRTAAKGSHFIFKLKYKKEDLKKALEILLNQNKDLLNEKSNAKLELGETVNTLIETVETFEENDLNSFGIKTIWVNTYAEIPDILQEIRTT
ncbi:SIR2 family protein [Ferruginibacter profundus]